MPQLNPDELPEHLLAGKTPEMQWLLRSAFEHTNQNKNILTRLNEMNTRQEEHATKLAEIDKLRQKFSGGKLVLGLIVSFIGGVLIVPLMCAFFLSWVEHWQFWKK
jgi:hypothetical protein